MGLVVVRWSQVKGRRIELQSGFSHRDDGDCVAGSLCGSRGGRIIARRRCAIIKGELVYIRDEVLIR